MNNNSNKIISYQKELCNYKTRYKSINSYYHHNKHNTMVGMILQTIIDHSNKIRDVNNRTGQYQSHQYRNKININNKDSL